MRDDLEARYTNYSTEEELGRFEEELEKLGERLDVTRSERLAQLDAQFGAKVAELRQMLEQLANTTAEVGNPTLAEELREAADRLAGIARRRQEASGRTIDAARIGLGNPTTGTGRLVTRAGACDVAVLPVSDRVTAAPPPASLRTA